MTRTDWTMHGRHKSAELRRRSCRLTLESLEERCLLAVPCLEAGCIFVETTADSGPGSLRAAITAANAAGAQSIEFDLPMVDPGFNGTWWEIDLLSPLPTITDSTTKILGATQTTNHGNTNAGQVGTGGFVGVDNLVLPLYDKPEIAIDANGMGAVGALNAITIAAGAGSTVVLDGFAIWGVPNNNDAHAIRVNSGVVEAKHLLLGTLPSGSDPDPSAGHADRNGGFGIRNFGTSVLTVRECYVGYNGRGGIDGVENVTVLHALSNEVFQNGWGSNDHDGIDLNGINGSAIGNLTYGNTDLGLTPRTNAGSGIELGSRNTTASGTQGGNLVENNTSRDNLSAGISIRKGSSDNIVRKNVLTNNQVGISVAREALVDGTPRPTNGNILTENSIFQNIGLGIDLNDNDGDDVVDVQGFDGVTVNDGDTDLAVPNDQDDWSNDQANFSLVDNATLTSTTLTLQGFTEPGSIVEFFIADSPFDPSGFGEGEKFIVRCTEGGSCDVVGVVTDTDAGTGTYGPTFPTAAGVKTVSAGPITTTRFSFAIPLSLLPPAVAAMLTDGTVLSSTAAVLQPTGDSAGIRSTSEFGPTTRLQQRGGGQGCTPGFWKQSHHFSFWTPPYDPGDSYNATFMIAAEPATLTLLDALKRGGGGNKALGRHAVAALLNAASPGVSYAFTENEVKLLVQQAYATGNFEAIKNQFETENERGCPLGGSGRGNRLVTNDGTDETTDSQSLLVSNLNVAIQDPDGLLGAGELARIRDAIATLNGSLASFGTALTEVGSDTPADIQIYISATSPCGTAADGVLGCENDFGEITLLQGWSWYSGPDSSAVPDGQYDYRTVITHELGHAVWLRHSGDSASVMHPVLAAGTARHTLTSSDLALVQQYVDGLPHGLWAAAFAELGMGDHHREHSWDDAAAGADVVSREVATGSPVSGTDEGSMLGTVLVGWFGRTALEDSSLRLPARYELQDAAIAGVLQAFQAGSAEAEVIDRVADPAASESGSTPRATEADLDLLADALADCCLQ